MKRLLISLATASFATSALAAFPINTNPAGSWVVGATGAFLEATASNGDFDYSGSRYLAVTNNDGFINNVESDYHWAWGAHVTYFAPNGANDITLRYFHARNGDDDTQVAGFAGGILQLGNLNAVAGFQGDRAWGSESTKLDQVDLIGGQYIPIRSCLNLHPFFGLRWAELRRGIDSTIFDSTAPGTFNVFHQHSKFTGIGPNIGMNANYFLTPQFSLVGHLAASLLVGDIKPHLATFSNNAAAVNTDFHHFVPENKTHRMVPNIDIKLGADYTYIFDSATLSHLSVEMGWKFSEYFNVFDTINVGFVGATTFFPQRTTSADFSLQGPYAEVSVAF